MLRRKAHKLLDQIPDSKLPEVIDLLNNMALGVPLMGKIPVYDMEGQGDRFVVPEMEEMV